jgi:hypothetical protein
MAETTWFQQLLQGMISPLTFNYQPQGTAFLPGLSSNTLAPSHLPQGPMGAAQEGLSTTPSGTQGGLGITPGGGYMTGTLGFGYGPFWNPTHPPATNTYSAPPVSPYYNPDTKPPVSPYYNPDRGIILPSGPTSPLISMSGGNYGDIIDVNGNPVEPHYDAFGHPLPVAGHSNSPLAYRTYYDAEGNPAGTDLATATDAEGNTRFVPQNYTKFQYTAEATLMGMSPEEYKAYLKTQGYVEFGQNLVYNPTEGGTYAGAGETPEPPPPPWWSMIEVGGHGFKHGTIHEHFQNEKSAQTWLRRKRLREKSRDDDEGKGGGGIKTATSLMGTG